MKRKILKMFLFFAYLKRNKKIKVKDELVKLNLGSGLQVAPKWINIDGSFNAFFAKFPQIIKKIAYKISNVNKNYTLKEYLLILKENRFVFYNLIYGIPIKDNSVDYLFSSHFLEHISYLETQNFLKNSYKCLRTGGVIRITIPDLEYVFNLYSKGEKKKALGFFFNSPFNGFEKHKYLYDYDMLKEELLKVGFCNITKCDYRRGKTPDLDYLDNRPDETLFVEANKMK